LIVKSGIADAVNKLPQGIRNNPAAVTETIANNRYEQLSMPN